MQFCQKCGSIMMPKKEKSKNVLVCPRGCKCKVEEADDAKIVEKLHSGKSVEVVKEEKESLPIMEQECPKCKHKMAYFWEVQTRASDEPATRFFKCEKCKHIWRSYD